MSSYRKVNWARLGRQTSTALGFQIGWLTRTWNTSFPCSMIALLSVLLCSSNPIFAQTDSTTTSIVSDKKSFDDTVSPFLNKYCADCHGESSNDSGVVLSNISFDLASGRDMEL